MSKPTNAWHGEIFFPDDPDAVTPEQNARDYAELFVLPKKYKVSLADWAIFGALLAAAALFLLVLRLLFW